MAQPMKTTIMDDGRLVRSCGEVSVALLPGGELEIAVPMRGGKLGAPQRLVCGAEHLRDLLTVLDDLPVR